MRREGGAPDYSERPQRGLQVQGLPDWQPQPQVDGAAAGVRQPQVQDGPGQDGQVQRAVSVFMRNLRGMRTGRGPWCKVWETPEPES